MKWLATCIGCFIVLGAAARVPAQVTVGNDVSMNMNGQISAGYTGSYGNQIPSDHGITAGGNATLNGSYYDPNFLSFQISPYFNQSRDNSTSSSISDSSGVLASASLFSGSNYPGAISYSRTYDSLGTFGVPGLPNYTTHGNSNGFNVGWGVNIPDMSHISLNYAQGTNDYSIYGTDANGSSDYHNFNAHAIYQIGGFNLNGGYVYNQTHAQFPLILQTQQLENLDNHGSSYSLGASHDLPFHGSFSANFNRSDFTSDFSDGRYSGTVDTFNLSANLHPQARWTLGADFNYTDNLLGTLYQNIVTAGGILQQSTPGQSSNSWDASALTSYNLAKHWIFSGTFEHRDQSYFGNAYGSNSLTGSVNYWNRLLGGSFSTVLSVSRTTEDSSNLSTVGLLSVVNYARKIELWDVSASGNYFQNTQTLLVGYTTSGWGYSGQLGRKFGPLHWNANAGGSRSLLNASSGYGYNSQNYGTGFNVRWFGFSGTYSKSSGTGLLGVNGVITPPLSGGTTPLPTDLILYGGHAYGGGVGINPYKRLTITASYARAFSDTVSNSVGSQNNSENVFGRVQYQYRQMFFTGGYSRFVQGFSASGTAPAQLNSFYVGVQRWFNFF
ncbi:MAG TPA: hypothetical protein VKA02_13275 [Candidatus Acidoferrum sp.]|nr:hypothetical protein [Candidatus Acidoferrum sp.]